MKKLILVLSLLLIFLLGTGMKSLEAQICWIEPEFEWSGSCVNPDDNTVYVIDMDIIDECVDPNVTAFNGTPQVLSTDNTSTSFCVPNQICTLDQNEPCFHVIVTLAKVNKTTQAVVCSMQEHYYLNCEDLMGLDDDINQLILN